MGVKHVTNPLREKEREHKRARDLEVKSLWQLVGMKQNERSSNGQSSPIQK